MFAIRSASGTVELSTKSEKVIVATRFGPNQAMKAFWARSTWPVPASGVETARVKARQESQSARRLEWAPVMGATPGAGRRL
jgi:hypothetical protein